MKTCLASTAINQDVKYSQMDLINMTILQNQSCMSILGRGKFLAGLDFPKSL